MSTVSKEKAEAMSEDEAKEYCEWCWYHDYGDCDKCAIYRGKKTGG